MKSLEFRNDPMFLRNHFMGEGTFEMPKIRKEEVELENVELVGYDKLSSSKDNQIVHFFLMIINSKLYGMTQYLELKS